MSTWDKALYVQVSLEKIGTELILKHSAWKVAWMRR